MEESTQQPNDNTKRQANSIETEAELDAAISAAIQRANEARSLESPVDDDDVPNEPLFANDNSNNGVDGLLGYISIEIFDEDYERKYDDLSPQLPIPPDRKIDEKFKDLSLKNPIFLPAGKVKQPEPSADDAVLGGQNPILGSSGVLGGIEGVKRRLASNEVESKIAALKEALNYGEVGLDLVVKALNNESKLVAKALYLQLRGSSDPLAQQVLQEYNFYQFFECTFSGRMNARSKLGISSIAISPDGQTLVGSNFQGTIKLWNLHTGKLLRSLSKEHSNFVYAIAIDPDGQTLVSGGLGRRIKFWNLHSGEELHTLEGNSSSIDFLAISQDGQTLVSASEDGTIEVWHLPTGKRLYVLKEHSSGVGSIAISPDGQILVSGDLGRRANLWKDQSIKLWNLSNGEQINVLKKHSAFVRSLAISPDSQTLASGSGDKTIKLWNLHSGEELHTLKGHSKWVSCLAISLDGQTLVSGSQDKTIKFWNLTTGKLLHSLEGHSSHVSCIAISPDGQTLVSGSHDATIKVWGLR